MYDNLTDTTPTSFSGLPPNVHNFWDRGLLGLALDPSLTDPALPSRPWVYVLYAYDHVLGNPTAPPRWGDTCPTPPGPTTDGCVVSGRLVALHREWHDHLRPGDRPDRGLVPAISQPLASATWRSGPTARCMSAPATARASTGSTTGSWAARPALRRPRRRTLAPIRAQEGGALRSQDLRTEPTGGGGGNYANAVTQDAPIAWYRMGEPSGAVVDQTGGPDGTAVGGVTRDVAGPIGAVGRRRDRLQRNERLCLDPGPGQASLGDGPWSIELWARRDSTGGHYRSFIDKGQTTPGLYFDIAVEQVHPRALERRDRRRRSPASTTDSDWHHWVVTRSADGTTTRMYKDGADVTTSVGIADVRQHDEQPAHRRLRDGGPRFFFDGAIDEVAIYNSRALGRAGRGALRRGLGRRHDRACDPRRRDPPGRPGHRRCLRRQSVRGELRTRTSGGSSRTACGTRSASTSDPGTNELWVGDVGWNNWEEINRVANIGDATVENFGWPCYEGAGRQSGYDAANLPICEDALPGRRGRDRAGVHVQPQRQRRHRATAARPAARRRRASRSTPSPAEPSRRPTGAGSSSPTTPGTASGGWRRAPTASRIPRPAPCSSARRAGPGRPRGRPGRRPVLRRLRWRHDPPRPVLARATSRRPPSPRPRPTSGPAPLTVEFNGGGSSDPEGGDADVRLGSRRRRRVRRLDQRHADLDLLVARHRDGPPSRHRSGRSDRHRLGRHLRLQHAARAGDRHARGGDDLGGRRPDLLQRVRIRCTGRQRAGEPAVVAADDPALPVQLPQPSTPVLSRCRVRVLLRARITSTPRTSS